MTDLFKIKMFRLLFSFGLALIVGLIATWVATDKVDDSKSTLPESNLMMTDESIAT